MLNSVLVIGGLWKKKLLNSVFEIGGSWKKKLLNSVFEIGGSWKNKLLSVVRGEANFIHSFYSYLDMEAYVQRSQSKCPIGHHHSSVR